MRDILTLHIGQCGIQQGSKLWEILCNEHSLNMDGTMMDTKNLEDSSHLTFFEERERTRYVPRTIFIDLESLVTDRIQGGSLKQLFEKKSFVSGLEDSANIFTRGRNGSKKVLRKALNSIRKSAETSNTLGAFLSFQSTSGGTGSGFASLIFEEITDRFNKLQRIGFVTYPSDNDATTVVAPYNTVFFLNTMTTMFDISVTFDNSSLYQIAEPVTNHCHTVATYQHLNELACRVCSGMTTSMRFDGELNVNIEEFQTNLVPYPRIHHMMVSHAPITTKTEKNFDASSVEGITCEALDPRNTMCECDPFSGKYISLCLMYRGADCKPDECHKAVTKMKELHDLQFIDWMPTGLKIGINHDSVRSGFTLFGEANKALTAITNNTNIIEKFKRINNKFDQLFQKNRAFVHWFLREGATEDDFMVAREVVASFQNDYNNVLGVELPQR